MLATMAKRRIVMHGGRALAETSRIIAASLFPGRNRSAWGSRCSRTPANNIQYSWKGYYLAFLQMLTGGEFNGARVLRPETVSQMSKNNIGDVNISKVVLKTTAPPQHRMLIWGSCSPGRMSNGA